MLAPTMGRTCRSTTNWVAWMVITRPSHKQLHSNYCPLPTMTRNGVMLRVDRPNWDIIWCWIKLCVLSSSTSSTTGWSLMVPMNRRVSGATFPANELKLIWVGYGSSESSWFSVWGSSCGSGWFIRGELGSPSSKIRRKALEVHLWPRWYRSS